MGARQSLAPAGAGAMIYKLSHLLDATVQRFAARRAITSGDEHASYADLDEQSARLAAVLGRAGVGRGDYVGLFLPKSIASIVGMFGTLRAGAAYVPIDAGSPVPRLAYITADSGAKAMLTTADRLPMLECALLDAGRTLEVVVIVGDEACRELRESAAWRAAIHWKEAMAVPPVTTRQTGTDQDIAYVLYTSGSTGRPKGVMISHRASLTFVNWAAECFEVTHEDVLANHAPLHFDLSVFDIMAGVKAGAEVVLVPERLSTFPVMMVQLIRERGITCWYSVPSALIMMLERGGFAKQPPPSLRVILFAGEVFPVKYLRALRAATQARLANLYGPTETNVCTWYEVGELAVDSDVPIPIGRAIDNYDVFALNESGARIRPGETGELLARGPGLMSGYQANPDATARALIANPEGTGLPNDLVYRTGDIVGLDAAGDFLFVGRRDHMIKTRGYRVELGEIEAAISAHPDVSAAVVVAIPDEQIANRLRAAVVVANGAGVTAQDIQRHCLERLPRYMVPESVQLLDSFPLTSSGKADRQALTALLVG